MSESRVEYGERDEHLVTDRKVCPLMSVPVEGVDCVREHCAWWYGPDKCCAVVLIAANLR